MKQLFLTMLLAVLCVGAQAAKKKQVVKPALQLQFNAEVGEDFTLQMPWGQKVNYTAFTHLYYVTNVEDSTYQTLNIFVPEGADEQSPIFLRTYVGGYMASAAGNVQAGDATGRALAEGYVVVIPGSRGRNSTVTRKMRKAETTLYTGRAPKALLDLKAAVRYLRHFDREIPGNTERIVTDGTSAGGAMSSLLGATGNNPAYEPLLDAMGAAKERDDVFASVCYCPITDLDHADMAYEWLYGETKSRQAMDEAHRTMTAELKAQFPAYIESLGLRLEDGTPLTADNYLDFIKREIIRAAQTAKNAGAVIPDTLGFLFSEEAGFGAPPINGGVRPSGQRQPMMRMPKKSQGDYITDLDMATYLNYVVSTQPLKTVPAFDSKMESIGQDASGENDEFGDETGSSVNFTDYVAQKNGTTIYNNVRANVRLLNPMNFIGDGVTTVAPHWYIRHGARDRDTAFPVPLNLALKLQNAGKDVNYLLAWNRPHSGDYALDELFGWLQNIVK